MEPVENKIRPDKIDLPVLIRRAAEIEILEAFAWYEEQLEGLGFEFLHLFEDAISLVRQQPQSYQNYLPGYSTSFNAKVSLRRILRYRKR